ncbi:MAG TPA: NADH-quinone oxidoreductase subunit NuoN [Gammaproteobacteria bacterium]
MIDYALAAPEIFLTAAICVVLIVDVFLRHEQRQVTYYLSMLALIGAAIVSAVYGVESAETTFNGSYVADPAGNALKLFAYLVVALVFLYSRDFLEQNGLFKGEFFVLGLFGLLGLMIMVSGNNLLVIYLGLELQALSLYALIAFNRDSARSAESAMKYFVLGSIASGMLLYGISLLYGITGTIELAPLAEALGAPDGLTVPAILALAFIVVGVAFKFGAVPFHMWIPDVYEGAPTPIALYVGSAPKIASFALMWRVLVEGMGTMHVDWQGMLIVLCVLSLVIGNLLAIVQTNFKRMLGYSTIAHVGFILMGFIAGDDKGIASAMYYTIVYVLMATAAFGMIILLSRRGFEAEKLDDFKGLNQRSPWFAFVMLLIMFSMTGVPPLVGFFAKLYVLDSVMDAGFVWLAALGVVFAVIGAFYYLRIVWYMYFAEPVDETALAAAADTRFAISVNGVALLALGVFPGMLLNLCAAVLG